MQSKKGCAFALHSNLRMGMSKNLFCLYKNLNLEFTSFTRVAIDSPGSVSSRMEPKYVTFVYCFIFTSLY